MGKNFFRKNLPKTKIIPKNLRILCYRKNKSFKLFSFWPFAKIILVFIYFFSKPKHFKIWY